MGKSTGSTQVPDPTSLANAQTQSNIQTATAQSQLNNVDQTNPWGSVKYTSTPGPNGVPKWSSNTTLAPWASSLLAKQVRAQQNVGLAGEDAARRVKAGLAQPLTEPTLQTVGASDYSADRQRVEDALMGRLNSQRDKDRAALEASLVNRGIRLGSDAYSNAYEDFDRGTNDQRTSAILAAGQEQSRLSDLERANVGFNNTVGQQTFSNDLTGRNQVINELLALMGGGQVQQPSFQPTSQTGVAGTDVAGITSNAWNQSNMQQQQQNAQWNNILGGLFSLGSSALMGFSDEELKENIRDTGMKVGNDNIPVKTWNWKETGEPGVGVIAQEVEKTHPELVDNTHPSGFKRVDYGGLMKLGTSARRAA